MSPPPVAREILIGLAAVCITACGGVEPTPPPQVTVSPGLTPTPTIEPTPTRSTVDLIVWLPASLAPTSPDDGARVLDAQIAEFGAGQPNVSIRVWPKKDHGPGGLLDLLRTASPVAPGALPDVIGLDDADLALAAREGLIQPVDNLLAAQTEADLFDFARRTARIDGKRMGMPWVADFDHTVLSLSRFKVFPATWTDLISDSISFPFAIASGPDVSDAVLADYESLGGTIISEDSQPTLSLDPLTKLLIQYRDGRAAGVISAASADWTDAEAAWAVFRASPSAITAVRASYFLSVRAQEIDLDFARMPVIEGSPAPPIGRSWSLALVARDPRRQALAAGLIAHLTRPDNAVAWTQARRVLPASAGALQMWASLNGYTAFTLGELKRAVPPPSPAALDAVSPAFLTAVRDVLAGRATPQQAAAAAVKAVSGGGK